MSTETNSKAVRNFEEEMENSLFPDNKPFTEEDIKSLQGAKSKTLKECTLLKINEMMTGDLVSLQNFRENFIGMSTVLHGTTFSLQQYADAVKFVTYKIAKLTNAQAYMRTFPNRYQRLLNEGCDEQKISAYVSAYNKSKLVTMLYEQSRIPIYIANADVMQEAINAQAILMRTAKSEKVRSDAANSLMTHLKVPEKSKIELDVAVKQDSSLLEMRESLRALAETQKSLIDKGLVTPETIASSKIINGTATEVIDSE